MCLTTVLMLLAAVCLWGVVEPVRGDGSHTIGYEELLFDKTTVHTIDITMKDWDSFIATATSEEYTECDIVIDGEKYSSVGIRAKGNTSLSSVSSLGSSRYSFKVEFNHYVKGRTYHGLDKLSLNNLIQDATMMKDYLAYTLMDRMDVPSSQCSYVQINVNGEPWGLYLAVEGVEDAFMDRNGMSKGELYKPDSLSFGGGRGNGQDFDFEAFRVEEDEKTEETSEPDTSTVNAPDTAATDAGSMFGGSSGNTAGNMGTMPQTQQGGFGASDGNSTQQMPTMPGGTDAQQGGFGASDGSSAQQMPTMPGGTGTQQDGFGASDGSSAQQMPTMPGTSDEAGTGTDSNRERGTFSFDFGGGMGMFNFGMGNSDVKLVYSDDNPDNYSNIFDNAKTKIKTKDKERLIESIRKLNAQEDLESVVNTDEVINYLAVHNFLCNDDSYTGMMVHNYYLYEGKGQLSIIPWDYNLAFGGFSASTDATSTVNSPIDSPVSSGTVDDRPLIAWIFSDEEYLEKYHEAYDRFITENIESGWLAEEIERVKQMITPYLEQDESAFYDMEEFEKAVDTLQTFCAKRGESIRGQLDGTIPSTTQGQRTNSAALIDASEISTSTMGSMNSGAGGGGGFGGMPSGMPSGTDGFSMPGNFSMPDGFTMPEGFSQMPDQGGFNPSAGTSGSSEQPAASGTPAATETPETSVQTARPEGSGSRERSGERSDIPQGFSPNGMFSDQAQNQKTQWIWLTVCSVLLVAAILIIRRAGNHNN